MAWVRLERSTWHDDQFRSWDTAIQHFWLYMLTNPHGNLLGCYYLDPAYAAVDLSVQPETVRKRLIYLSDEGRLTWDGDKKVVLLHNWLAYNPIDNRNVAVNAAGLYENLPYSNPVSHALVECIDRYFRPHYEPLKEAVKNRIEEKSANGSETVNPHTSTSTSTIQEPEPERNTSSVDDGEREDDGYPSLGNLPRNDAGHRQYPEEFEKLWKVYPDRDGPNPKGGAYRKWRANIEAGVAPEEMYRGVLRYRKWLLDRGKIGGQYVSQAKTFLGPQEMWREEEYAGVDLSSADQQLMTKYQRLTQDGGPDEHRTRSTA